MPSPGSGGSGEACVFFGVGLVPSVVRDDDVALASVIFPDASRSQAVGEHLFVDPSEELPDPVSSIPWSGVDPVLMRAGSGHPDEQTSGLAVALCDAHVEDVSVSRADVRESVVQPTALPRVEKAPCCLPAQNLNDGIVTQHDRILPCARWPIHRDNDRSLRGGSIHGNPPKAHLPGEEASCPQHGEGGCPFKPGRVRRPHFAAGDFGGHQRRRPMSDRSVRRGRRWWCLRCCTMSTICPSAFDRWRCDLILNHSGEHECVYGSERARWNERATGHALRKRTRLPR